MNALHVFWRRLLARRAAAAGKRDAELRRRTPAERRFVEESIEERQLDTAAEEWLGGDGSHRRDEDDGPGRD